jgi:nucleotide-binding universal stress UspA family protein
MPYRHLLVICDGSSEADDAVRAASELARRDRAKLTVAAVVELERPGRSCVPGTSTWNEVLRDAARADLDRAARILDSPAAFTVLYGEAARAAAEGARVLGCDAIMLSAPSRRRLGRLLARDRASALRRRATCPVLQPR